MLETLDHTIRIGSTPTFLYFEFYLCPFISTCMYMLTICSSSTQRTEISNSGVSPFNIIVQNATFAFHHSTLLFTMQHSYFIIQHCCSQCNIQNSIIQHCSFNMLHQSSKDASFKINIQHRCSYATLMSSCDVLLLVHIQVSKLNAWMVNGLILHPLFNDARVHRMHIRV